MFREKMQARSGEDRALICSACGAEARRGSARFCLVCGKLLSEDYQPLDAIRSSHGLQRMSLTTAETETEDLFEKEEKNTASQIAWACFVYSLVPYLGLLFVPLTFAAGGLGYFAAYRRPEIGGGGLASATVGLSFPVLAVQIFLWWLLYIIPELGIV